MVFMKENHYICGVAFKEKCLNIGTECVSVFTGELPAGSAVTVCSIHLFSLISTTGRMD